MALAALLLGLALVASPAWAYDAGQYPIRSEYAANQTINTATHYTKSWTVSPDGANGVKLGRDFTMKAPGGRSVTATAGANLSKQAAIGWGARALAAGPYVGTALLLYSVYDAVRVHEKPDGTPGLLLDPGGPPVQRLMHCEFEMQQPGIASPVQICAPTASALAGAMVGVLLIGSGFPVGMWPATSCTPGPVGVTYCSNAYGNSYTVYGGTTTMSACGDITVDGTTRQGRMGADGKCETGNYTDPITEEQAAARAWAGPQASTMTPEQYKALVDQALGVTPMPITEQIPMGLGNTVPYVPGPSTTTTNPDGSTVQTAIGWNFQPYGLTKGWGYAASGNFQEVKSVLTKDANGNVISSTTSTTETEGQTPEDVDEKCGEAGNTVSCTDFGEAPSDQVPKSTVSVSFMAESLGLPSACPAPVPLWNGNTFSFTAMCQAAGWMRPFVIAAAALSAALMCVFALRGGH